LTNTTSMPPSHELPNPASIKIDLDRRRFYKPELDGLRFYAFMGVFLCHTLPTDKEFYRRLHLPVPWLWSAVCLVGASGVDLFFALSAFLITSLLMRERVATGEISLRHFYIRRVLRIWPLYFLIVTLGVICSWTALKRPHLFYYDQYLPWYYIVGYIFFFGNWVAAVWGGVQSICSPLWTVSIEEQFYLIWPLFTKFLNRRAVFMAGIGTFLFATAFNVAIVLKRGGVGYIYFGSASRCDSLAVGILLSLLVESLPKLTTSRRMLLLVAGGLVWIASTICISAVRPEAASYLFVAGRLGSALAAGIVLYSCLGSNSVFLSGRWVVGLGKISYGLYMLHFTGLLVALSLLRPHNSWGLSLGKILGFVLTVCFAAASYRLIESPFLRLKSRFAAVPSRPI
jgi:peptidoglycan/LPS O-acetylase OafA/YrhL